MLGASKNQFSFTRAALSTFGAQNQLPINNRAAVTRTTVVCALGLVAIMAVPVAMMTWSLGRPHSWIHRSEVVTFHSGEKVIREDHFLSSFPQTALEESRLFFQRPDGHMELLASTKHNSMANHYALSQDGDMYVVSVGGTVYYRQKASPESQWGSWTLTASPEIYHFIKKYLDDHSPNSYAPQTNEFARAGAFKIRCSRLGVEQPLIISLEGNLSCYEIGTIRNLGRELVAVPFASNPFAPTRLIFSRDGDSGRWKFNETLTAAAN